jgi:glycosyltransferase involved in cell wall biosynthesis
MDALLLRDVDYYFGASHALARNASERLKLPSDRWEYLPNPVDIPAAAPVSKGSLFTVAQVARVTPEKNQEMALAVARRLRAEVPSFRWLLIGRTNSRYARRCLEYVDRMHLGDHVVFMGERDDVVNVLRTAHVGVLTSRYEALPMALLEYMVAQLPVIVTDTGECGTIVRASGGGDVVASGDVAGFADALRRLAMEPAAAQRAGVLNRRYVEEEFGGDAVIRRVADTYHALLSGRAAP